MGFTGRVYVREARVWNDLGQGTWKMWGYYYKNKIYNPRSIETLEGYMRLNY